NSASLASKHQCTHRAVLGFSSRGRTSPSFSSNREPHRMSTTLTPAAQPAPPRARHAGRHWIDDWRPEDPKFWETTGKAIARRNLIFSIFAEHVGFSVWMLWSIVVVQMTAGAHGHPGA